MIDLHSHLIPSVDDGSKSIENTVEMLKEARQAGFTDIVLTPHFMENSFETDLDFLDFWRQQLQKIIDIENLNINLYNGNEVFITDDMDRLLLDKKITTIANSRYLLIELPLNTNVKYVDSILFKLKAMHIVPIIAHPERYSYVQDDIEFVQDLVNQNYLIQCNFGSIYGAYGKKAQKTIKKLLKRDLVHLLSSDCHSPKTIYTKIPSIIKELKKTISEEQLYRVTIGNAKKILNNETIINTME